MGWVEILHTIEKSKIKQMEKKLINKFFIYECIQNNAEEEDDDDDDDDSLPCHCYGRLCVQWKK